MSRHNQAAWIVKHPQADAYTYIYDSLEKAQKRNRQLKGRFIIIKVNIQELVYEKNTIEN